MHDPLCLYYALLDEKSRKKWIVERHADVRVECTGTWTRGMTLLDRRVRAHRPFDERPMDQGDSDDSMTGEDYEGVDDDEGGWRAGTGNRVDIVWGSSTKEGGNLLTVDTMGQILWDFEPY